MRKRLLPFIEWFDHRIDRFRLFLKLRYGWLGPVHIFPYDGHGNGRALFLTGRILEEKEVWLPSIDDTAWRNMRAMIRRFLSDEVPGAQLRVRFEDWERVIVADDEGFFEVNVPLCGEPLPERAWHEVDLEVLWPVAREQEEVRAVGKALVPRQSAAFGVISDIDDTIVRTGATSVLTTLRLVLFSNAHTRLPFEGVAAFYRALRAGGGGNEGNPIFYVSTGPWNLYDLISDFLRLQEIPRGPIFLKDWGGLKDVLRGMNHRQHKLEVIRKILDTHSALPFVLVGDSGQQDAETYAQIAREYPNRILAIYIRDIDRPITARDEAVREISAEVNGLGVPMLLVENTIEAADHAAKTGLINYSALPEIREDKKEDAQGPLF